MRTWGRSWSAARRRGAVTVVTAVTAVAVAGSAAAYVNALGGGTGYVQVESSVDGLVISGNASTTVVPGEAVPLSIKLLNSNNFPVRISQVTARVSAIDPDTESCNDADFAVVVPAGTPVTVPARKLGKDGSASWPSGSIELQLADRDQSACLGRTVYLRYDAK
jgi:hypothetical protein